MLNKDLSTLYEELTNLEMGFDLFDRRIQGVRFWELVRFEVFRQIVLCSSDKPKHVGAMLSNHGKIKSLLRNFNLSTLYENREMVLKLFRFFFSSLKINRNPLFSFQKDILFIGHPRRVLRSDTYWWDIYTDFIVEKLTLSSVTVEPSMLLEHRIPAKTRGLKYLDILDAFESLASYLGIINVKLTTAEKSLLTDLESELRRRIGSNIKLKEIVLEALKAYAARKFTNQLLLKRIQPKVIVLTTSYTNLNLIRVAQKMRIPVVELQHGLISPNHIGYSYPKDFHDRITFPDFLFTFGEHWKNSAQFPVKSNRIVPVGFPFLENEFAKYRHIKKKDQILFISAPFDGKKLANFAAELSNLSELKYDIVFKLHPRDCDNWRDRYPELQQTKIRVIDASSPTLYRLFAESKILVGVTSTAVIEGLMCGLETYLIDAFGIENLEHFINIGAVKMVSNARDLYENLRSSRISEQFQNELYFRSNATKRIVTYIQQLAQRKTSIS